MRASLERFAWRMWRGEAGVVGQAVGALLLPFEGLWRLVTRARNRRLDRGGAASVEGLLVVSVGNVAVGGTGKTPLSAWVAARLRDSGLRPCILLRGYGSDEAELHAAWNPDVPVEVDPDRVSAAHRARARGCDVAVLDDGFQHRAVDRILDVVLVSAEDPIPGAVLPRGPYREPLSALRRADVVVVTRRSGGSDVAHMRAADLEAAGWLSDGATVACVHLAADGAVPLVRWAASVGVADRGVGSEGDDARDHGWDASDGVVALTSVARPEAFRADVAMLCGCVAELDEGGWPESVGVGSATVEADLAVTELVAYPDHHDFTAADARHARARAGARPIFMTEKDAVKLRVFAEVLGDAWVVRQRLVWSRGESDVRRRLDAVVETTGGGCT